MKHLALHLLGAPRFELDGESLAHHLPKKALALLAYLAVTGKVHEREWLASLLWSNVTTATALKNLRDTLPDLRQRLGETLTITRQTVALIASPADFCDVTAFHVALRAAPAAPADAAALYHGDFLADFHIPHAPLFDDWVLVEREHLHALAVQQLDTLVADSLAHRTWQTGLDFSQRLLTLEPWRESTHRQRMQLLAHSGQRAAALEQYALCRKLLADEFGVTPTAQTEQLYQQIRANQLAVGPPPTVAPVTTSDTASPAAAPPAAAPPAVSGVSGTSEPPTPAEAPRPPLPRALTPFFGRETELARLIQLLTSTEHPLVTLMGEGGIGKTRLALTVAQHLSAHFPDDVCFVPLADLPATSDENAATDSLARALSDALALPLHGPVSPAQQLSQRLRARQMLVVLDGFEHLMAGSGFLVTLLEQAPHVSLLVASRERLHVPGETVVRLHGLPVPQSDMPTVDSMSHSSVQLFAERAARLATGFVLDASNLAAVIRICRLLAGLPLGIELAAAMTERESCATLADTIAASFAHLTTTLRGLPSRHRSLQAVFDHSWHLLAPDEAQALARCAIFQGHFSSAIALTVAHVTPTQLAALVNKSLLHLLPGERYTLHALIHQFAYAQLEGLPAMHTAVAARHCAYYLGQLQASQERLENEARALQRIQDDLPNIRAAWQWGVDQRAIADLTRGVQGLALFFRRASLFREAQATFATALAAFQVADTAPPVATPPAVSGVPGVSGTPEAQRLYGFIALEQSYFVEHLTDLAQANILAQTALATGQALGDRYLEAGSLLRLAPIQLAQGQVETSLATCQQGLALAQAAGLTRLTAIGLAGLGLIMQQRGAQTEAASYHTQALAVARQHGYRRFESIITGNLSSLYMQIGRLDAALSLAEQALTLSQMLGDENGRGLARLYLGDVHYTFGDYPHAHAAYHAAQQVFNAEGNERFESIALAALGLTDLRQGLPQAGHTASENARRLAQTIGDPRTEAGACLVSGQVRAALGDFSGAHQAYERAHGLLPPGSEHATLDACRAELCLHQGQLDAALTHIERVLPVWLTLPLGHPLSEPFHCARICMHVLEAAHDPRATTVYAQAEARIMTYATQIESTALRQTLLATLRTGFTGESPSRNTRT